MIKNVIRYGQMDMPEWARATDDECCSWTSDHRPPKVDHAQLEIEYREVKRVFWDEFKTGSSEMGVLYKAHEEENVRKHGRNGVFEDLGRFWPEHTEEIARSRIMHRDIEIEYAVFEFNMKSLQCMVGNWLGDCWRNANAQI